MHAADLHAAETRADAVTPFENRPAKTWCTTCPYCGVGCGVSVTVETDGSTVVSGDDSHPANHGKLCLKGQSLAETLEMPGRLLQPVVEGKPASWDDALDRIASQFRHCIETYGPESVAFYVSGQLLTEDYYVVNKFVKGYLGTANIDTNSRLCMASSVAGHKRAFGADTVPGCYEDLELADLVILVGSNLAWCHPVLHQRLSMARECKPDMRIITVDPRATATSDLADDHLPIAPDSDTALFSGLLKWLVDHGATDNQYISESTSGLDAVLAEIDVLDVNTVSRLTGLDVSAISDFFKRFSDTNRVVTVYSQGVNQSVGGTDKVNAIINCHLATGRIGKPGCGPFSITGQPNAMGGRETGGLANMLTCHMDLDNADHRRTVQGYWGSPHIADKPGLKAVELFQAIHAGKVRAVWIMATNPVVSMPDADFVSSALERCEFVVQSDVVIDNDTAAYAHVRLPAQAWSEKDGTVTNSERCISRQRRFRQPAQETRPDWWAVSQLATRLGYGDSFGYQSAQQIFSEYATLSGLNNNGSRDFDISACAEIDEATYDSLEPFYWPAKKTVSTSPIRFFSNGGFYTPDQRGKFVVTPVIDATDSSNKPGILRLNTGRVRDQWHTMTRTGFSTSLSTHTAEPFVEIHPTDAADARLQSADLAVIKNDRGSCILRVVVTDRVGPGNVFVPMHWCSPYANAARVDVLVAPVTDPVSGQPALKHSTVRVSRLSKMRYGFAVSTDEIDTSQLSYVARARCNGGWRTEFAFSDHLDTAAVVNELLSISGKPATDNKNGNKREVLELKDNYHHRYSLVVLDGNRLQAACFIADEPVAASRDWLVSALNKTHDDRALRHALLAARSPADSSNQGRLICTCFGIGENQIVDSIINGGCATVASVGKALCAGTNCGSCRGDISALIKRSQIPEVA